jgi:PAS domain S-box-containing protein
MGPKYQNENNIRKMKTTVQITKKLSSPTGLVILGIIFVGVMVYVGFTDHIKFKSYIVNQNKNFMLKSAESIAKSIIYYIQEHVDQLQMGSRDSHFRDNIFGDLNKIKGSTEIDPVKALYEINIGDFDAIYAIDHKGTVLHRHPLREGAIGDDYSEKPGFKYASEFQKTYLSKVFKANSGKYAVSITVPVLDNGRFIGVLRWLVESERIFRNFLAYHDQDAEAVWLIDSDGKIISHPVKYHVGNNYLKIHKIKYPDVDWSELENIIGSLTTGKSGVSLFNYHSIYEKSSLAEKKLIAYAPIRVNNQLWAVGIIKNYADITGPIDENAKNTALQIVALSLVFGGLGYSFHRMQKKKAILETEADNLREITKTLEALRKSEEKIRSLTTNIPVGIFRSTADPKGKFIEANPMMIKMFGYDDREEFLSLDVTDIYQNPSDRLKFIEKMLKERFSKWEELNLKKKDGTKIIGLITAEAVKDEKGNVLYVDGIVQDITVRKRMEEERIRLYNAIETSMEGVNITDNEGNIIYINDAYANIYGYKKEDLIGKHTSIIISPEGRKDLRERLKAIQEKGHWRGEVIATRRDGSPVPVLLSATLIKNRRGSPIGMVGIIRDITERKRAENIIRDKERFLSNIFNSIQDGISILDNDMYIIRVNSSMEKWYQHSMPLVGKKCYHAYHGRQEECKVCPSRNTFNTGESSYEVVPKTGLKGEIKGWLDLYVFPMVNEKTGEITGVIEYVRDITERIKTEEELRIKDSAFESSLSAIGITDIRGKILYVNDSLVRMWGYESKDEIIGRQLPEFWSGNRIFKNIETTLREGGEIGENIGKRKDGITFNVQFSSSLIKDEKGQPKYFFGSFLDITKRKKMEEEVRNIETKLLQANKMTALGTLVSEMAHEINNPNNFIMFNTPILLDTWQDAMPILEEYYKEHGDFSVGGLSFSEVRVAVPRLLSGISDGSSRIKNVIESLRDFARDDRRGMERDVDINKCIHSSITILNNPINKATYNFNLDLQEDIPAIRGNSQKIEQVIINLLMNSLQALPDKKCGIWVSSSYDKDSGQVIIMVKDEGVGMTKDMLEHSKELFYSTKHSESMGLGLSICYSIVEKHKGSLEFESEMGRGTTATIKLLASQIT